MRGTISYDSFGTILSDSDSTFAVPFGFAGGLHDRDTGLVKFGFRDYDPAIGRWVAKDPIFFAGGDVDLYGYVLNDPVNFVDPSGLFPGATALVTAGVGFAVWVAVNYKLVNDGAPAAVPIPGSSRVGIDWVITGTEYDNLSDVGKHCVMEHEKVHLQGAITEVEPSLRAIKVIEKILADGKWKGKELKQEEITELEVLFILQMGYFKDEIANPSLLAR